jgi:FtsZ-binding cell division protein ZapB
MAKFDIICELTKAAEVAYHEKITYAEAIQRINDRYRNGDHRPYSQVLKERAEAAAKQAEEAVADERVEEADDDERVADDPAENDAAHENAEDVAANKHAEVVAAPKKKKRGRVAQLEKLVAAKEIEVEELKEKVNAYEDEISEAENKINDNAAECKSLADTVNRLRI